MKGRPLSDETPDSAAAASPELGEGVELTLEERENLLVEEMTDEVLRLRLDNFEGPFEVLLYLIRSQEIDIFDIPIVRVTEQYLQLIDQMRTENLDLAGDFLVMAAQLIEIKSKMILPVDIEDEDEEVEEEDPRLELVEKLLEYRRFRDLAKGLGNRGEMCEAWYGRRVKPMADSADDEEDYLEVSLYDLLKAIRAILRFLMEDPILDVMGEGASIEEKVSSISERLEAGESVTWMQLYHECRSRVEVVCCLLAILELCRMRRIRAHQHHSFGDIRLFAHKDDTAAVE
jgi:segregation and condensation protein A